MRSRRYPVFEKTGPGKFEDDHLSAMTNPTHYPTMDAYGHMRAMTLCASLPDEPKLSGSSATEDHPFSAGYSEWDQKMINRAAQLCGFPARKLGTGYSKEGADVHSTSPVNHNSGKHKE